LLLGFTPFQLTKVFTGMLYFPILGETCNEESIFCSSFSFRAFAHPLEYGKRLRVRAKKSTELVRLLQG